MDRQMDIAYSQDVVFPSRLYQLLLRHPRSSDTIALLTFYWYLAVGRTTNHIRATDEFCMYHLKLGWRRFYEAKNILKELKLISQVQQKREDNTFEKVSIQLSFFDPQQCDITCDAVFSPHVIDTMQWLRSISFAGNLLPHNLYNIVIHSLHTSVGFERQGLFYFYTQQLIRTGLTDSPQHDLPLPEKVEIMKMYVNLEYNKRLGKVEYVRPRLSNIFTKSHVHMRFCPLEP